MFKRYLRSAQKWDSIPEHVHASEEIETLVMPTILAQSCLCAWDCYLAERYLDPCCVSIQWTDQGQLGTIYQGLTKYITARYEGSLHLPKLKQQACSRSPIARTLYLLKKEYEIHITTANKAFLIKQIQLESIWKTAPAYASLTERDKL